MDQVTVQQLKTILKAANLLISLNQNAGAGSGHSRPHGDICAVRQTFIQQRGLRRYIHDMLGDDARQLVRNCRLLTLLDRVPLEVDDAWATRPLVDFFTECYTAETIPCFVIVLADNGRITKKLL